MMHTEYESIVLFFKKHHLQLFKIIQYCLNFKIKVYDVYNYIF